MSGNSYIEVGDSNVQEKIYDFGIYIGTGVDNDTDGSDVVSKCGCTH